MEATASDVSHDFWPVLGIPDPEGRLPTGWVGPEQAALVAVHKEESALHQARVLLQGGMAQAGSQDHQTESLQAKPRSNKQATAVHKSKKGKGKESAVETALRRECGPSDTLVCTLALVGADPVHRLALDAHSLV